MNHFIRVDDSGRHQPFRLVNGRYSLDVGPSFATPREAMAYTDALNAPATRPSVDDLARDLGNVPDRRDARLTPGSPESANPLRHRG
jgi:hypothetical protein